jgi:hypothetical protein
VSCFLYEVGYIRLSKLFCPLWSTTLRFPSLPLQIPPRSHLETMSTHLLPYLVRSPPTSPPPAISPVALVLHALATFPEPTSVDAFLARLHEMHPLVFHALPGLRTPSILLPLLRRMGVRITTADGTSHPQPPLRTVARPRRATPLPRPPLCRRHDPLPPLAGARGLLPARRNPLCPAHDGPNRALHHRPRAARPAAHPALGEHHRLRPRPARRRRLQTHQLPRKDFVWCWVGCCVGWVRGVLVLGDHCSF